MAWVVHNSAMASVLAEAKLRDHAFGVDLHPTRRLLAAGLITGQLKLFEWDEAQTATANPQLLRQRWSARPHKEEACRVAKFSVDGATIFSSGGDCTLQQRDVDTNKPVWRLRNAAAAPVNAMARLSEVGVATGDDEGAVICWDVRSKMAALKFQENNDYVSDMLYVERPASRGGSQNTLVVAGGDGYLSVFDLRAGRLWARSDPQEDELLCLSLCKRGRKLCCGTQEGEVQARHPTIHPCARIVAATRIGPRPHGHNHALMRPPGRHRRHLLLGRLWRRHRSIEGTPDVGRLHGAVRRRCRDYRLWRRAHQDGECAPKQGIDPHAHAL